MKLTWRPYGASRPTSIAVPPLPSLIDWYALDYDPHGKRVLYAVRPDDDERGAELHAFDGTAWTSVTSARFQTGGDHIEGGGYDTHRRAFVVWGFDYDYDEKRELVRGTLITADGAQPLEYAGPAPLVEPSDEEHDIGTFEKHGAFAFDTNREVWVCLTRQGAYELGAGNEWTRKCDGADVPQDWHDKSGEGFFDPIGKRSVFWLQGRGDGYPLVVLTWNGERIERLSIDGLPDLHVGLMNLAAQVGPHYEHGIVVHIGGELYTYSGSSWRALPAAERPPVKLESALVTCDPERKLLVIGPGKHEDAGGSNRHRVFYVLRDGAWEQQGNLVAHSPLKDASYGKCRMAHAGGVWYATSTHSLQTWKYENDAWREIVDKETGEKLVKWELLELCGGERLHAIAKDGSVHVLDGEQWNRLCKADAAFKERTEFVSVVLPDQRLVVWGGQNPRKLNDTLFFEAKKWRATKKSSPKPDDFKHGNKDHCWVGYHAIYDTAIGALVRFGYEEVAVLGADEVWALHKPKQYKALVNERVWGHVPAHDPETGETLLVDFAGDERTLYDKAIARVIRFDLARCEQIATIEYPFKKQKMHDAAPYHSLAESFSYDPTTKSIYAQVLEDSAGTYRLDLAPAFAEAKGLGPRTVPKQAEKPAAKDKAKKPTKR